MDLSFDLCKQEILARELVPVLNGWHRAPRDMNIDNKARWAPMFLRFGGNQAE